jgi:quinoprotein glucose dehydrogenase
MAVMPHLRRWSIALLACAGAALGPCASAQTWTEYGSAGGRHFSALEQITPANVGKLKQAWEYHSGDLDRMTPEQRKKTSFQATPLKLPDSAGGHLVLCTPLSRVVALDPVTGRERWAFDPKIKAGVKRPILCRGIAFWEDSAPGAGACRSRLFLATYDRRLVALDASTGKPCEDFGKGGSLDMRADNDPHPRDEVTHSSPPIVVGGAVIVGSGIVDFVKAVAPSGAVHAFDVRSGRPLWSFDAIPASGDGRNWPDNPRSHAGAANAWAPLSGDAARDLVFLPTSSPSPDYYGAARKGDNRHADSLVALRASTGEVVWSFQFVHHDLWDYDTPAQPILVDLPRDGKTVPAVIQVTKQGLVFVLNRETGVPLWPVDEVAVSQDALPEESPAPTQPVPRIPAPLLPATLSADQAWGLTFWDRGRCRKLIEESRHHGRFTPITEQWTLMLPGSLGGANWGGAAVDTARGVMIVNYNTAPARARMVKRRTEMKEGEVVIEGFNWHMGMGGTPYDMQMGMLVSPLGIPCIAPPWGKLAALDLATGAWLWDVPLGSIHDSAPVPLPFEIGWGTPTLGGGLLTATGVFFIGSTMDRSFRAIDAGTGQPLWRNKLPADAMATPMSYEAGGRQFVVVAAGGHYMFAGRAKSDTVIAYALAD